MKDNMPSGRTSMSVNPSKVKGVVIPLHATFDKLAALWIIQKVLGRRVPVVSYSSTDPNDQILVKWREAGYYLLDVGANKYQTRRTGSATETVCRDFNVTDPILLSLVAVANRNNQTGYLKGYSPANDTRLGERWAFDIRYGDGANEVERVSAKSSEANWGVAWLLREAYKVGIDTNQVIKHVHSVLDAWYQVSTGNLNEARWKRRVSQHGRIQRLWELFGNPRLQNNGDEFILPPFSVPWLVWSLAVMGEEELEASSRRIEQEVQWWISVQKAVVNLRAQAKHWAVEKTSAENIRKLQSAGHVFELAKEQGITVGYFPADETQARELWPQVANADDIDRLLVAIFSPKKVGGVQFGCLVIRNPHAKRVAIMAGKEPLDFGEVCARLTGLEQARRLQELVRSRLNAQQCEQLGVPLEKNKMIKAANISEKEIEAAKVKVWHLDVKGSGAKERHWLLNGSDNWPLPPTILDIPTILGIVRKAARRFK